MSVRLLPFGYPPENPSKYPLKIKIKIKSNQSMRLYFRQKMIQWIFWRREEQGSRKEKEIFSVLKNELN